MGERRAEDMEHWLEAACQRRFWAERDAELTIEGPPAGPVFAIDDARRQELWNDLLTDGYFQLGPTLPADRVERLARAMRRLREDDIPMVFAFVYDEFWHVSAYLSDFLSALLGPGFRLLPDLWGHYVEPGRDARGWHPHRDKGYDTLLPNGLPRSLSIWLPLTDATVDNGCMYVLPACRDPYYRERKEGYGEVDLHEVHALPASAGSILGWNQGLLHWGSRSTGRARAPRISLAIEYQRGDCPPFNAPLLDPLAPPPFERRLGLCGKQILQYRHMYELGDDLEAVAQRLLDRFPLQGA